MARGSLRYLGRHCTDNVAPSYHSITSACAASAAEARAERKEKKYSDIACNYHFFPIAFETFGLLNQVVTDFISALGHRTSSNTDESMNHERH